MKDPSEFILATYASLLDGIEVDGDNIPLFDRVKGTDHPKYIVLFDVNVQDYSDNDTFQNEVYVELQIVTIFKDQSGGKRTANRISNGILETLYSTQPSTAEFRIFDTQLINNYFREEDERNYYAIRKFVTIRHLIEQL